MTSFENIAAYLESHGWTRAVAGDVDFGAAVRAVAEMVETRKGIIVSGTYGCGKTSLARVLVRAFGGAYTVRLGVETDLVKFQTDYQEWWGENPHAQNVFLDDLGAEAPGNEFGVRYERATDFILAYHTRHEDGTRLLATTNLSAAEIDERYGGRLFSRLKDLCIPLKLTGKDKRTWG